MPAITTFKDVLEREEHFRKHGADFGSVDSAGYEAKAKEFLEKPMTATMVEGIRHSDGCLIRFDERTNEFAIAAPDGTIITYYKPQPAWKARPGTPRHKAHRYHTNRDYYEESLRR